MERYFLFGGELPPCGGWWDFRGAHWSLEDAKSCPPDKSWDWWHIVDIEENKIIEKWEKNV